MFILCSCSSKPLQDKNRDLKTTEAHIPFKDTSDKAPEIKLLTPDYFDISTDDFIRYENKEINWFISADGLCRLYFVPYTDYSITTAILTNTVLRDTNLIHLLNLEKITYADTTKAQKVKRLESKVGIRLGSTYEEVTAKFGVPETEFRILNGTKAVWSFNMVEDESNSFSGGLKPFIMDGLEFRCEMTFDLEDKLILLVYRYQVP